MGAYEINEQLLTKEEKKLTINKISKQLAERKKCFVSLYRIQSQF